MRPLYYFAVFLVLYELSTYLANDMILPGMVQVIQQFHAPSSAIALSLSFYILGNCALTLVIGGVAERFGKRLVMLMVSTSFVCFSIAILFSQSIYSFLTWRFLAGCGLAAIPIGYSLIHSHFNDKKAVKLIALMGNITILAPLVGPIFGSLIVNYFSWQYVFYVTIILSIMAFLGLYRYTPTDSAVAHSNTLHSWWQQYRLLLKNKVFWQGTVCISFSTVPILLWISQAPRLILMELQQDYYHYAYYQLLSIGGIALASFLMQYLAGRYRMYSIVKTGSYLLLAGLLCSALLHQQMLYLSLGQFFYTLGLGLVNGCLFRLVMSDSHFSKNILASLSGFIQSLSFVIAINRTTYFLNHFKSSLFAYTLITLSFGILAFYMTQVYIKHHQDRQWQ